VKIHGSASQTSGIPDIIGCYRGRFVGLEVKVDRRELSLRQEVTISRIREQEGYSRVIRSTMDASAVVDEIDRALDSDVSDPAP
jgi:hypothetical protein